MNRIISDKVSKYVFLLLALLSTSAQGIGQDKNIPDIPGYHTLKCDFHIHTVFSDGKVYPDVRVAEAISEGLDAIAITDHLKYGKLGKYDGIQVKDRNHSYDIARETVNKSGLIVIRGAEITQGMPPGHINAIFLTDANIAQKDYIDTFKKAKEQDAFIFWNHPFWKSPDKDWEQNGIPEWFDIHTTLVENNTLQGIEVVNGGTYSKEAHQWCIDKNLTMLANSDIHTPIGMEYDLTKEHRPTTLVFAKEKNKESIKEALMNQRTALWFENNIIGDQRFLEPLFEECITVQSTEYLEKLAVVTLKNGSGLDFMLENSGEYSFFNKTDFIELKAGSEITLIVKTDKIMEQFDLTFSVKNMLIAPDTYLSANLRCKKTGTIKDKKQLSK